MLTRTIPSSGEELPVIGLGTWQTFDVGSSAEAREPLLDVLKLFRKRGGRVIDSSPMYGRAESVTGDLLAELGEVKGAPRPFLATKVWTQGRAQGIAEMNRSFARLRTERMDLMQVHNLLDWQTHLPVLRDWKSQGRIRYIGITHYAHGAFGEMEKILRTESDIDFVQLPYNLADREAEKRLLPAAKDTGTAVLVMRPFDEGSLLRRLHDRPLPSWADELECTTWSQVCLKFILGHPAVTCPIPATSSPEHLADNVLSGEGPLPDEAMRKKMIAFAGT
ncbi:MAG: aldo/keto reductase [Labilithrix sp.]|nr:aldo/keto reductase [Labilithrix sp.]